jgi:hypothetical protein
MCEDMTFACFYLKEWLESGASTLGVSTRSRIPWGDGAAKKRCVITL